MIPSPHPVLSRSRRDGEWPYHCYLGERDIREDEVPLIMWGHTDRQDRVRRPGRLPGG